MCGLSFHMLGVGVSDDANMTPHAETIPECSRATYVNRSLPTVSVDAAVYSSMMHPIILNQYCKALELYRR